MNDEDDAIETFQFVAQDTEVIPYDDGFLDNLETIKQDALPPSDEDPTTFVDISGDVTV